MPEYTEEQRGKIISTYERLRKLCVERKKLMDNLDHWYHTQVLGLVPKKSYKIVEITEWVKPDGRRTTGRSNPSGDCPAPGA